MRIAFLGKGGAGKTTTAAGFIRYLSQRHPFVLAIDADVNAHLSGALQIPCSVEKTKELGEHNNEILDYLKNNREDLGTRPMVATTPPSLMSNFVRIKPDDYLIEKFSTKFGNIALLTVGTYKEGDVGGACYHTKLTGLQALFHHMLDTENDYVVADTTAGTDNVATSLSIAYDMNVFVLEPSKKSVQVYADFIAVAPHLADKTFVIANKVDSQQDLDFILKTVPAEKLLGSIPNSKNLKRFEQGKKEAINEFHKEQEETFAKLMQAWKLQQRDWPQYLESLRQVHRKVCREWLDDYFGERLDENLDSNFSYESLPESNGLASSLERNMLLGV